MNRDTSDGDASASASSLANCSRRRFLGATVAAWTAASIAPLGELWAAAYDGAPLDQQVNAFVKKLRAKGLVSRDEETSWSVYDFTTGEKLVSLNEDTPRQAASMIKPFVAQAYFFKVIETSGRLRYTDYTREVMERSIRYSSNPATNELMRLVIKHCSGNSPREVERVLKKNAPGIFQQTRIVETIPTSGQTYRNMASAHDYARFLHALWNDTLPYSSELKNLMSLPNRDRITYGVQSIPDSVVVYDKTGSTARLCGDMGIVEALGRNGRRYPYTFVGIIEKDRRAKSYGRWISERGKVLREVSNLVYSYMKRRHNLV
jgi:beta-lactamase class A